MGASINDQSVISVASLGAGGVPNLDATFSGSASVDLDLQLGFDDVGGAIDQNFPSFTAALLVTGWSFGYPRPIPPRASIRCPRLCGAGQHPVNFGQFLNNYLGPILQPIANALEPIEPVLNFLNQNIPILNTSVLGAVIDIFGGEEDGVSEFFQFVQGVIQFASDFAPASAGGGIPAITLGSFDLNSFDLRQPAASGGDSLPTGSDVIDQLSNDGDLNSLDTQGAIDGQISSADSTFSSDEDSTGGGISFPILDNPKSLLGLIFGQPVNLVQVRAPELTASADESVDYQVYPYVVVNITGSIGIDVRFAAGYDSTGMSELVSDIKAASAAHTTVSPGTVTSDLLDGFYIDDSKQSDGLPATYVGIDGSSWSPPASASRTSPAPGSAAGSR